MASTTFTNGVTLTDASWFQDVNSVIYTLFGNGSSYTGALTLGSSGNIAVNTNKFTVAASTGNTLVAGTLSVTGHVTLEGVTSNAATGTGALVFGTNPTISGLTTTTIAVGGTITVSSGQIISNSTLAAGNASLQINSASGANRDILFAGVTGVSTGFTVQYVSSEMVYSFGAVSTCAINVTGTIATSSVGAIGTTISTSTALNLPASVTGTSTLRIAHGAAPTSPVNGDVWSTTSGLFIRINGTTKTVTLT